MTEISAADKAEELRRWLSLVLSFFFYMTIEVSSRVIAPSSGHWRELNVSCFCLCLSEQKDFVGLSFPTISSVGPNGAIIHYRSVKKWKTQTYVVHICHHFYVWRVSASHRPLPETNRTLTTNEVYLIDSGAQYMSEKLWYKTLLLRLLFQIISGLFLYLDLFSCLTVMEPQTSHAQCTSEHHLLLRR